MKKKLKESKFKVRLSAWKGLLLLALFFVIGTQTMNAQVTGENWEIVNYSNDLQWNSVTYGNGTYVAVAINGVGSRVMTSNDGVSWVRRQTPVDNLWTGVTYGNGLFVAVAMSGTGNRVMTSPDGITWTIRSSPVDNQWYFVDYVNGLFIATALNGTGNRVMTSPDGITWTIRNSPSDNQWTGVAYGNGLYVSAGYNGSATNKVMTSPDGITWTLRNAASDNAWTSIAYGNGLFVAVAFSGLGNRVMTSPDGITWTSRTAAVNNDWKSVTYANGLFVAVAGSGTGNRVMTSPDGINWTSRASATDNYWRWVTYGNGLFVAVAFNGTGNRVMTSPDGITWTSSTSVADNGWSSVTYGNGLFAAVSQSGTGNRVMTSPDGIAWTNRASSADNNWSSVTYGNGLYVAVSNTGTGNRVMTSSNGITWTSSTSAADNSWSSVTYGNGLFVAAANTGTGNRVMTSPDGITWTSRASATDNDWSSVTYGNDLYVAVSTTGTGDRVMTSPDGITWTSRTSAADNNWSSVTYGHGMFVAVAKTGTGNRVMTSPDGITWTSRASAVDNTWNSITYVNGMFVAVAGSGTGNRVMTSPDGINWRSRVSAADNSWSSVVSGNGLLVAVSTSGIANRVMISYVSNCTAPTISSFASASRCEAGAVTLTATPSAGSINWYDAASNGTLVGSGTSLTLPSILTTTTYYAEAIDGSCVSTTRTAVVATVNSSTTATQTVSQCGTYTWAVDSQTYSQSGTYTAVLTNAAGCDSTITLNLTIKDATSSSETVSQCGDYTWAVNGQNYTQSGTYAAIIPNAAGCDSTVTLNLTIKNATTSSTAHTTVNPYTWNGTTYNVPGSYTFTTINAVGCDSIATLDLTFNVFTTVKSNSCNSTLSAMTSYIYANSVSGATKYKFKVTNTITNQVQEIERSSSFISLAMLPSRNYTTPYSVEVAVYKYGRWSPFGQTCVVNSPLAPTTSIIDAQQNSTLAKLATPITAKVVSGANRYKFEVIANGLSETYISSTTSFNLTQLPSGAKPSTVYIIKVAFSTDNGLSFSDYGSTCTITTPAPLIKIRTGCGTTLSTVSTGIYSERINGATNYRFKINNNQGTTIRYNTTNYYFNFLSLSGLLGNIYGKTFTIEVAYSLNGGSTFIEYGEACNITTPIAPTTKIRPTQCATVLPTLSTGIWAVAISGANKYKFEVVGNSQTRELESTSAGFRLTSLAGGVSLGTVYTVKVAYSFDGGANWSAYGDACTITTPAPGREVAGPSAPSALSVYPNPFTSTFKVATTFEGLVSVRVMDLTGKLVEQFDVEASELVSKEMGQSYVPGMYQVTVSQDTQIENFKIVKND